MSEDSDREEKTTRPASSETPDVQGQGTPASAPEQPGSATPQQHITGPVDGAAARAPATGPDTQRMQLPPRRPPADGIRITPTPPSQAEDRAALGALSAGEPRPPRIFEPAPLEDASAEDGNRGAVRWLLGLAALIAVAAIGLIAYQLGSNSGSSEPAAGSIGVEALSPEAIESLTGPEGPQGPKGARGPKGEPGVSEIRPQKVLVEERTAHAGGGELVSVEASCGKGRVIGGGAEIVSNSEDQISLVSSSPSADRKSWSAEARYLGKPGAADDWSVTARALCAVNPKPDAAAKPAPRRGE